MRNDGFTPNERALRVLLTQCAWCKRVKLGGIFVRLPWLRSTFTRWSLRLPFGAIVVSATHGVCLDCAERVCERAVSRRTGNAAPKVKDLTA
jgi:hypothetical protein